MKRLETQFFCVCVCVCAEFLRSFAGGFLKRLETVLLDLCV